MSDSDESVRLYARARRVTPGGVHSPVRGFAGVGGPPRFIASATGAHMTDVDGNELIDFCLSWGPLIFGHADPDIVAAATTALERGSSFGAAEAASVELAERIVGAIPWVEKIRFVNSGTEAVMTALRIARAATGRDRILKFDGCYHGHSDSMLVRAGSGLTELATPDSAGVPAATAADTLIAPLDDDAALARIFAAHGEEIAAVIVEPVPANYGLLAPRPEWLRQVTETARAHGALVIFDEVITGFRLAFGGAAEWFGLAPDLVTYGKIIGGGFPVGACGGRADLLDRLAPDGPVYQAGTLSANPVAMAAGNATLTKLLAHPPYADLEIRTAELAARLESLAARDGDIPVRVQAAGSMFWVVFGDIATRDGSVRAPAEIPAAHRERFRALFNAALEAGVYLPPGAFEVGFLSTAHNDHHLARLIEAFGRSMRP